MKTRKQYTRGGNDSKTKRKRRSSDKNSDEKRHKKGSSHSSKSSNKSKNKQITDIVYTEANLFDSSSSLSEKSKSPKTPKKEDMDLRNHKCHAKIPESVSEFLQKEIKNEFPNEITQNKIDQLIKMKFQLLCDITNEIVPPVIENLNINVKHTINQILGNHNYALKIIKRLTDITGIKLLTPMDYNFVNTDLIFKQKQHTKDIPSEEMTKIIDYMNNNETRHYQPIVRELDKMQINKIHAFAIPIYIPEHINMVIIHATSKTAIIELFEPNGWVLSDYLMHIYQIIEYDCREIVSKIYPGKRIIFKHPLYLCYGQRPTCQSRLCDPEIITQIRTHTGSCTIFSMWYLFNRALYLKTESARQTYKTMDTIIRKDPTYISKLVYSFLSLLSANHSDLVVSILVYANLIDSQYTSFLDIGKEILSREQKKSLYIMSGKHNNIKLYNALREHSGYKTIFPGKHFNDFLRKPADSTSFGGASGESKIPASL